MIVGISGFKDSGKGVLANVLVQHGYICLSFASPLKDAISILFDWDRDLLEGKTQVSRDWREKPDEFWQCISEGSLFQNDTVTPRLVLQKIGTNLFRHQVLSDFWLLLLLKRAKTLKQQYEGKYITLPNGRSVPFRGIVVDDARFFNELDHCDLTICVERFDYTEEEIAKMPESERAHLGYKFHKIISNRGTLEEYLQAINSQIVPVVLNH